MSFWIAQPTDGHNQGFFGIRESFRWSLMIQPYNLAKLVRRESKRGACISQKKMFSMFSIVIKRAQPVDTGYYTCELHNGRDPSLKRSFDLRIKGVRSRENSCFLNLPWFMRRQQSVFENWSIDYGCDLYFGSSSPTDAHVLGVLGRSIHPNEKESQPEHLS